MLPLNFERNRELKILCLGAHCDDIEIGCGGTLLKIFDEYNVESVKWVVYASNEIRKKEAENCAHHFLEGVDTAIVEINEFRDGFLPFHAVEVKEKFEEIKSTYSPDLIFTHYREDRHQDHRFLSDLTWNTFRNHFILEYEIPKYDGDLGVPNFYVDLQERYLRKKSEFLLQDFKSQAGKHWFDQETFFALPRLRGMESAARYAEAFYSRKVLF